MLLPFFFEEELPGDDLFNLGGNTSRHIIQVLRMRKAEQLQLTDGKGKLYKAEILSGDKKIIEVKIISRKIIERLSNNITIAISLIKNNNPFEWFLEKATEIGVSNIIPLLCERTERQHFRYDRMRTIIISAMLQSQQAWLPLLSQPVKFEEVIKLPSFQQKYIAHCIGTEKQQLTSVIKKDINQIVLIGPEGDFTQDEIDNALKNKFLPVTLGKTRLRTETAGVVACVLLNADKSFI